MPKFPLVTEEVYRNSPLSLLKLHVEYYCIQACTYLQRLNKSSLAYDKKVPVSKDRWADRYLCHLSLWRVKFQAADPWSRII